MQNWNKLGVLHTAQYFHNTKINSEIHCRNRKRTGTRPKTWHTGVKTQLLHTLWSTHTVVFTMIYPRYGLHTLWSTLWSTHTVVYTIIYLHCGLHYDLYTLWSTHAIVYAHYGLHTLSSKHIIVYTHCGYTHYGLRKLRTTFVRWLPTTLTMFSILRSTC